MSEKLHCAAKGRDGDAGLELNDDAIHGVQDSTPGTEGGRQSSINVGKASEGSRDAEEDARDNGFNVCKAWADDYSHSKK